MNLETIEQSHYYHIYNRGINGTNIFKTNENKRYFLELFGKYVAPNVEVFGYCLMDNHFHFLIRVESEPEEFTQAMSNFFNAYAKAFNKFSGRTGSLFEKHFKRKKIVDERYLRNLLIYIHMNPEEIQDYTNYKFSSLHHYLNDTQPKFFTISKDYIIENLFDSVENLTFAHKKGIEFNLVFEEKEDLQGAPAEKAGEHLAGKTSDRKTAEHLEERNSDFEDRVDNGASELQSRLRDGQDGVDEAASDLQGVVDEGDLLVGLNLKIPMKEKFVKYIKNLQNQITSTLEEIDGKAKFQEDIWVRDEGGGGQTRVIENGNVFEKGGVNISEVHGKLPESMQAYFGVKDADFFACGLSLVLHPKNPMVPTVHANWRYFEMYDSAGNIVDSWFGGGQDLTPYYLFEEDARHFHQVCKTACDKHSPKFYDTYKKRCDEYFWNSHRNEARGIGGLFFDYLKETGMSSGAIANEEEMKMQDWYNFVTEVGNSFLECYVPIVEKRKDLPFTEANRTWQEIRRGRYVEFNLVHDKGTLFGLKTNGRIESILMSLPPHVQWKYDHHPELGSDEEKLIKVLEEPKDWI